MAVDPCAGREVTCDVPFQISISRSIVACGFLTSCLLAACGGVGVSGENEASATSSGGSTSGGTGGTGAGSTNGTSTGVCLNRPDAGEFAACKADDQCRCGLSCESDTVLGSQFCEYDCQQTSDCASVLEVCENNRCRQNYCGPGTGNGQYDGPCNVAGTGDGFCFPFFENGETLGICQLSGSAALGARCSLQPARSSPASQLCGSNAICESTCLLACDPLQINTCAAGTVCTALAGLALNSPHLGVCKPGSVYDGGFAAAHLPFPQIPFNGGSVINSPRVITLSFPKYQDGGFGVSGYADWIVGSSWLQTVGADYGVGLGTHVKDFVFPSAAPAQVNDSEIQQVLASWIADGGIPPSTASSIYLIYYPVSTTITMSGGVSCQSFGGYHDQFALSNGTPVTYGVIATCQGGNGNPNYGEAAITTSHELVEAATDPDPQGLFGNPGYRFNDQTLAWTDTFSEAADLCEGSTGIYDSNYAAQRIWSNSVARTGASSPCVPVPSKEVYFNASASPNGTQFLSTSSSAQIVTYQITPWSLSPASGWYLIASQLTGSFSASLSLTGGTAVGSGVIAVNNGDAVTLQVTVPPANALGFLRGDPAGLGSQPESLELHALASGGVVRVGARRPPQGRSLEMDWQPDVSSRPHSVEVRARTAWAGAANSDGHRPGAPSRRDRSCA